MTAEEYLNKYCKPDDWNNLEECLKDSILTNNVIEHMELYAALRKNEVVGQSEQLLAFGWYMMEHSNVNDGKTAKDYLEDFLSQ
jgi:hypothetical protein